MIITARSLVVPAPWWRVAGRQVSWFHLCGAAGAVSWIVLVATGARARGLDLGPLVVLAGSAVATFVLLAIGTALVIGEGRLTWFHHQLGIVVVSAGALMLVGAPVLAYLDLVGTGLVGFAVFGRLGCLLVGCCHGRHARRGVVYGPDHVTEGIDPAYAGRAVLPVQLFESVAAAVLTVGCMTVLSSTAPAGTAFSLSLVGYAALRFPLEYLRGDQRPRLAGLSEAQWTAVAVCVCLLGAGSSPFLVMPTSLKLLAGAVVLAGLTGFDQRSSTLDQLNQLTTPQR